MGADAIRMRWLPRRLVPPGGRRTGSSLLFADFTL
jgi:hypothetical protein